MVTPINLVVGIRIIIINLIHFIFKKPDLLLVTAVISTLILFLLRSVGG